jgi:hypothetical protein
MLLVIAFTSLPLASGGFLFDPLFYAENEDDIFLRNLGLSPKYTVLQPRVPYYFDINRIVDGPVLVCLNHLENLVTVTAQKISYIVPIY